MKQKQVILVRRDLKMSPGKVASQVAHASIATIVENAFLVKDNNLTKGLYFEVKDSNRDWLMGDYTKVVLGVDSDKESLELYYEARKLGIIAALIEDEGRTELDGYNFTTVGIGPDYSDKIDKVTKHLKRF